MKENRKKCVLCENNLTPIYTFKMPIFMGININNRNEQFSDMTFSCCDDCGEVQINELLDLNLLYHDNHNIGVIGKIWDNHYNSLAEFIGTNVNNKIVLEISDPSAKIAKKLDNYVHWYIVEPNPDDIKIKNVSFINKFFDDNFNDVHNVDVIVNSHLLEHIHNPNLFFKKCYETLKDDGTMIISVPDMSFLINNMYSPNNILHFEHTYYLDDKVMEFLVNKNGFEIVSIQNYCNHSVFYKLKKSTIKDVGIKLNLKENFLNIKNEHIKRIETINEKIKKYKSEGVDKIYLFGAHVSSQFYCFQGLNIENITCVLDNSETKQNHKLYGTSLIVKSPDIIKNNETCLVICSHSGLYFDEIAEQLISYNNNVIIL